jgi:predicted nucleotide-binding protein
MIKPSIFIGSSSEALDFPRAVQEQLSSEAEVTIWNELPSAPGQFTVDILLNNLKRFDFAVFVFSRMTQ